MNSKLEDSGASSKPKRARLDVSVAVVQNVREPLNLTTLPVEMLDMIFSYLDKSKDIMAVAGARLEFDRMLRQKIVAETFDGVFPFLIPYLSKQDILNCRLVGRKWSSVVDRHLENAPFARSLSPHPYRHPAQKENFPVPLYRQPAPHSLMLQYQRGLRIMGFEPVHFANAEAIRTFIRKTENHPRNPFLLRYLDLGNDLETDIDHEPYWNAVHDLLSRFGSHVWRMHLSPVANDQHRNSIQICYQILRRTLQLTPNLNVLTLGGFLCHECIHPVDVLIRVQLKAYTFNNPLPRLPNLEVMENTLTSYKSIPVVSALMKKYSSHLTKVFLLTSQWGDCGRYFRSMPNLTELAFGVNCDDAEYCARIFRNLHVPQLGKLTLYIRESVRMKRILSSIRTHLGTVTYLAMQFNDRTHDHIMTGPANFSLPNVKTMEILENDQNVPYDLLLSHLPDIENILVCCHPHRNYPTCECVEQFEVRTYMRSGSMYESNIWTKLKSLKEFTIGWSGGEVSDLSHEIVSKTQYTREKYDWLKEKKVDAVQVKEEEEGVEEV